MPERLGTAEISRSIFNPYPGLRAFEPDESFLYFGRERQTDELMRRLRGTHFLAVVGTSGSGKSSLVRAGLVPALHSGYMALAGSSWRVAILRPGGEPIKSLAEALADPEVLGGETGDSFIETTLRGSSLGLAECVDLARIPEHDNVLIVVDQFEELFRYKRGARDRGGRDEAVAFVKLLLAAAAQSKQLYVVITMRSDFIGDCMEFPRLPEAINEGQYLVPRMTRDELRMAITGPAGVRSAKISPRLVARLLNDVGDNPDHLPVLQHALMRMWTLWEGSAPSGETLDLGHYKEIGTMEEALSRHAEKAYGELSEIERGPEIAERLFKALAETEQGGRGVRRPAPLGEICEIAQASLAEVVAVIDRFRLPGRSFLMPPHGRTLTEDSFIDLSHESLMRNWDRLVQWTREEAGAAETYRDLSRAAALHEAGKAGLWRTPELDLALDWRQETRPTAAWARRYDPEFERAIAFLDRSARERDERLARVELERRKKARRKTLFAAIIGITVVLGAFLWYVVQKAKHLQAVSVALSVDDPLIKAQVLTEVPPAPRDWIVRLFGSTDKGSGGLQFETVRRVAYEAIPRAVFRTPARPGEIRTPLSSAAVSPGGDWIVIGAANGDAWIWKSDATEVPIPLIAEDAGTAHGSEVTGVSFGRVSFGSDGDRILTSSADGKARVWDLQGGLDATLSGHRGEITSASFSPDGSRVATASNDRTVRIWPIAGQGDPIAEAILTGHEMKIRSVSFSPDGERIVTASDDRTARIWTLAGEEFKVLRHQEPVRAASFSAGGLIVTASLDRTARIWDFNGEELRILEHDAPVIIAAFSNAGDRVVTVTTPDETARIWDVELEGPELATLSGHRERITSASFGPNDERVATASVDGTARLWNTRGEELRVLRGHTVVNAAAFSGHPGRRSGGGSQEQTEPVLVTAGDEGQLRVWPLESGEPRLLGHYGEVTSVAFSPDGERVVSASKDGIVRVWSLADGALARLEGHRGSVASAAFSPDGERIVTSGRDSTARIWKTDGVGGWSQERRLTGHEEAVTSASFSPSGAEVVTASKDGTVRIWSLESEEAAVLRTPGVESDPEPILGAVFGPGGDEVLTSTRETLWIWQRPAAGGTWTAKRTLDHARIWSAALSAAGDEMVIASSNTARIWRRSPEGWLEDVNFFQHRNQILDADFDPEGSRIVTSSQDGTVRVWDAQSGLELYSLRVAEPVRDADFSPDGKHIVTGTSKNKRGKVEVWRVSEQALLSYLESSTTTCLGVADRCQFLGEFQWTARYRFRKCEQRHERSAPGELETCR